MGKLVTVESGAMIGDFADISANTKVPLIFTTEMLAGKVFVPIQPPEQSTDVTIVRFSGDGNVFFYNQIPFSPFFQFFTWSWSIDGNGRLINDFPDPMPDRTVTLLANTPTYLEWQVVGQAQSERVIKVIPFNTVTLPGTYFIDGGGIITFFGNGTGSMGTENFTWSVDTMGVLIATFTGTNVVRANYLLADSTATTLNIAGIEFRNGDPVGLFDATLIRQ
jgi:hypothetical protein